MAKPLLPLPLLVLVLVLAPCAVVVSAADGDGLRSRMFTSVESLPCSRLISADGGAIGCGSEQDDPDGEGGSLYLIEAAADVVALRDGNSGLARVALVVPDALLTGALVRDVLDLHATLPVDSVIVTVERDAGDAPAQATSGMAASAWTSNADGLNALALPFPVTRVRSAIDSAELRTRARENRDRGYADAAAQHAARFSFFQGPLSASSGDCLQRGRCDPAGGLSVWATVGALADAAKPTVLLAAALDASALFHDLAFGRDGAASGAAAALLAAHALAGAGAEVAALPHQIAVALFNAEAADRSGSRRFVRDIASGAGCRAAQTARPYNGSTCADPAVYATAWTALALGGAAGVTDVLAARAVAAGGALPLPETRRGVYAHAAPGGGGGAVVADFEAVAAASAAELTALLPRAASGGGGSAAQPVPPSPLDSFLRAAEEGFSPAAWAGAGLVLAGFDNDTAEAAPRLDTRFDRADADADAASDADDAARVGDAALLLARTAFVRAGGSVAAAVASVTVNRTLAAELWGCLTRDFACALVARTLGTSVRAVGEFMASTPLSAPRGEAGGPPPLWAGIYAPFAVENGIMRPVPLFARDFLAQLPTAGAPRAAPQGACARDLDCMLLADGTAPACALGRSALACIQGACACVNAYFHDALSPSLTVSAGGAISIADGFNASVERLWTEARWDHPTLTLFQRANGATTEIALIVTGLLLTVATYAGLVRARRALQGTRLKLE